MNNAFDVFGNALTFSLSLTLQLTSHTFVSNENEIRLHQSSHCYVTFTNIKAPRIYYETATLKAKLSK